MSGSEDAAAAGAGAAQRLPEQDQDANRRPARQGKEGAGAEGLTAKGSAGTESKKVPFECCLLPGCQVLSGQVLSVNVGVTLKVCCALEFLS